MADILKAKLEKAKQSGSLALSSADVIADVNPEQKDPATVTPVTGPVKVPVPEEAQKDVIMNTAADGDPGKALFNATAQDIVSGTPLDQLMIEITDDDRNPFIDAIVNNARYVRTFSLYGGRLTGKFRSRTQSESMAVLAHLNMLLRRKEIVEQLQYATLLRAAVLAAQVAEFNDVVYPELMVPLYWMRKDKDDIKPKWIDQMDDWMSKQDAIVTAVYDELQIFERKYWSMTRSAPESNFWPPAQST